MTQPQKLTRKEKEERSRQAAVVRKEKEMVSRPGRLKLILGLVVAAAGFLLYIGTVNYGYTLDDFAAIQSNQLVKQGAGGIGTLLHTSYWYGFNPGSTSLYRPLSLVMFALEWQFFPGNPAANHFMNILLYALTGFLLFNLLCKLFKDNLLVPFVASLLFMAHPVHTEVVASIKSRDEILCMLFVLVCLRSLLAYAEANKISKLIVSASAFFLALISKENALTVLAVIPLLLFVFRDIPWKRIFLTLVPFCVTALVYVLIKMSIQHGTLIAKPEFLTNTILSHAPDYFTRMATAMYVLGRYLMLLIFPVHLSMDYSFSEIHLMKMTDTPVLLSIIVYSVITALAVLKLKKKDAVGFSMAWFIITISLVSNLVILIGTVMGDRLLYMPSLGFALVLALLAEGMLKEEKESTKMKTVSDFFNAHRKAILFSGVIFVFYSFKTLDRNPVWKDNESLITSGLEDAPNSAYIHYLYANELIKSTSLNSPPDSLKTDSVYNLAVSEYKKAIDINPGYAEYYSEMGGVYHRKKNPTEAMKYYDLALKHDPGLSQAYNGKGVILCEAGKFNEAMEFLLLAVKNSPADAGSLRNLGSCYLALGDNDRALSNYFAALQSNPNDPVVLNYIGMAYQNKGDKTQADVYFAKAQSVGQKNSN